MFAVRLVRVLDVGSGPGVIAGLGLRVGLVNIQVLLQCALLCYFLILFLVFILVDL